MTKARYLIIGSGRMATHWAHYFKLQNIDHLNWSRDQNKPEGLLDAFQRCTHTLLSISDQALEAFILKHCFLTKKPLIHMSAVSHIPGALCVHPLMTFGKNLYDLETYHKIPLVVFSDSLENSDPMPGLTNQKFYLPLAQQSLYHAWCVMAGNFTTLLWQEFFKALKTQFNLPPEVTLPYLQQITTNLINEPENALTGPIARKDFSTINKHLFALKEHPMLPIYEAFIQTFALHLKSPSSNQGGSHVDRP